jgi:hypothetical protein
MRRFRAYLYNVLLAIDQLGNTLAAGEPDETISSRVGKWKLRRLADGEWPPSGWHPLYWLERGLDWVDPNHVLDAIERDEGEAAVVWKVSEPR